MTTRPREGRGGGGGGGGGGVCVEGEGPDLHGPPGPIVAVQQATVHCSKHVLPAEGTHSHETLPDAAATSALSRSCNPLYLSPRKSSILLNSM